MAKRQHDIENLKAAVRDASPGGKAEAQEKKDQASASYEQSLRDAIAKSTEANFNYEVQLCLFPSLERDIYFLIGML